MSVMNHQNWMEDLNNIKFQDIILMEQMIKDTIMKVCKQVSSQMKSKRFPKLTQTIR